MYTIKKTCGGYIYDRKNSTTHANNKYEISTSAVHPWSQSQITSSAKTIDSTSINRHKLLSIHNIISIIGIIVSALQRG